MASVSINNEYIGGINYEGGVLKFVSTAEGRVVRNGATSYSYEYTLADHLGNGRVYFDINGTAGRKIQEVDYYAFGLDMQRSLSGTENKYLYNWKEKQDQEKMFGYGARFYDPVIARWNVIDPLSEKSRRVSPYVYGNSNPIRFIDPDGMENKDWIEWRSPTGTKQITYDADIKTADQALTKGYTNVNKVFASGTGSSTVTGEQFEFQEGGKVADGNGNAIDLSDGDFVTKGGNRINKSKNGYEQAATGLQATGDGVTAVGLLTGQPEIAVIGSILSNIGLGIEVVNSFATSGFNQETITKNGVKIGLNVAFGTLGDVGVSATRTVAGQAAVSSGANVVSESIIEGTTVVGSKVAEKLSQDLMKKKKQN